MMEKQFGQNISLLRKGIGLTQEDLAFELHVSPQAISKWENGHSLPETALLPSIAKLLAVTIDELFNAGGLTILEALFGDGIESVNVAKRLSRLIENEMLRVPASASLLGIHNANDRVSYLVIKYQSRKGICHAVYHEGDEICLSREDGPIALPDGELQIIAGSYGTQAHHCDVMQKVAHYRPFHWNAYRADHATFQSDPANTDTEYLTLVYQNKRGIHMVTCAEGEDLKYNEDRTELSRSVHSGEYFIRDVPKLPPFGSGMECSWAASLTVALKAMRVDTDYTEVMGNSGACWRLAFCSPGWDYSSVDGLVAYDYATSGFAAYGYTPEQYCHVEKPDRAVHRERIMKEIRNNMPVMGINLRVAPEWGVICGYRNNGTELFCRTKYDEPTIENDPAFMKGHPKFQHEWLGMYDTMQVDNWPFLLCYFAGKQNPPSPRENLNKSLSVFLDCATKLNEGGYHMGFHAYDVWASDLRDDVFYQDCDDELFARRFSVNQFCALALYDARNAARDYLERAVGLSQDPKLKEMAANFAAVAEKAKVIHHMLDSGDVLDGERCRIFWTADKRLKQAKLLDDMAKLERAAHKLAAEYCS